MVPFLGEMDTVEGELDIPVPGIDKGDIQFLCQQLVFLCKVDGLSYQYIRGNPGTTLHRWRCYQQELFAMRKQWIQKGFHSVGGFLCGCALEQVVGTQHPKENIHRCVFGEQTEGLRIARNLPAIGTGIDYLMACLLCQQINPAIFCTIMVTEVTSGIVAISVGISETQYPHRNHLRWIHYST